jgi:hypothetical protein
MWTEEQTAAWISALDIGGAALFMSSMISLRSLLLSFSLFLKGLL